MKKGITAVTVAILVTLIVILTGTVTISSYNSLQNAKKIIFALELSNIQEELDRHMRDSIESEYPITGSQYTFTVSTSSEKIAEQFDNETKNSDNEVTLYEFDLSAIGIDDTEYGNKKTEKDIYVLSKETGRVFYLQGIKFKDMTYYTLTQDLIDIKERNEKEEAEDNEEVEEDTYTIYTDSANKTAPIPKGFTVSTISGETTIDGGLVIYEGTEPVTNVDSNSNGIIDVQETRNQFVWVPVDDYSKFQRTTTYKPEENITAPSSNYTEPYYTEEVEYNKMKVSVQTNGGFYIGRYESGTTTEREYDTDNGTTELLVQKGKNVYNWVCWGQSMTDTTGEVTDHNYGKNQGLGAVELSRNMYNNSTSVVSTLCYGVQWDAALRFIATKDPDYPTDSTGNYTNYLEETGYYPRNNIYDMAGNVDELTMEVYSSVNRVFRGGSFRDVSAGGSAVSRDKTYPSVSSDNHGFRITLYIK